MTLLPPNYFTPDMTPTHELYLCHYYQNYWIRNTNTSAIVTLILIPELLEPWRIKSYLHIIHYSHQNPSVKLTSELLHLWQWLNHPSSSNYTCDTTSTKLSLQIFYYSRIKTLRISSFNITKECKLTVTACTCKVIIGAPCNKTSHFAYQIIFGYK